MSPSFQQMFPDLPWRLIGTASAWKQGKDVRSLISRSTWYRHRHQILERYGIDIAEPCKVIDLPLPPVKAVPVRQITISPVSVPDWYQLRYGTGS